MNPAELIQERDALRKENAELRSEIERAESAAPAKHDIPPRFHSSISHIRIADYLRDYANAIDIGESQEQATHAQWLRKAADAIEATPAKHPDTERLDVIRQLCGYIEDGSSTEVRIFQDDATGDWFVNKHYGTSLREAIDAAREQGGAQ